MVLSMTANSQHHAWPGSNHTARQPGNHVCALHKKTRKANDLPGLVAQTGICQDYCFRVNRRGGLPVYGTVIQCDWIILCSSMDRSRSAGAEKLTDVSRTAANTSKPINQNELNIF
jgi:hypothetical protein